MGNEVQPVSTTPSTRTGSLAIAPIRHANHRTLPAQGKSSTLSVKCKHLSSTSHSDRDSEDTLSDSDRGSDPEGDGSSSGDSIHSNDPIPAKRPRIYKIATRASAKASRSIIANSGVSINHEDGPPASIDVAVIASPPGTSNPRLLDTSMDSVDDDTACGLSRAGSRTLSVPSTGVPSTTVSLNKDASPAAVESSGTIGVGIDQIPKPLLNLHPQPTTPTATSPPELLDIDPNKVPAFLRSHGKGSCWVDIFRYLDKVEDLDFRCVLCNYIKFETNDKSGISGTLHMAKRPTEIAQWTSKARPAGPLDHTKGKRTLLVFANATLTWWGSLQPSWRSFELGQISRQVQGVGKASTLPASMVC